MLQKLVLACVGGGLIVYGVVQRGKTKPMESEDPSLSSLINVPDPVARSESYWALFIGGAFVLGAFFA